MKKHVFPIILIAVTLLFWLVFYSKLPAELPIHWGINGEVNGFATKFNAILTTVGAMILMYVMLVFVPKIDPKKENYKFFYGSYRTIIYLFLLLLFFINIGIIFTGLGYDIPIGNLAGIIVGLIFIVLGNYMQQFRPNYFIGIRTPWTLYDENVWKKTHRFGGKVFVISGIIICLTTLLPSYWAMKILLGTVILCGVLTYAYSYWVSQNKKIG